MRISNIWQGYFVVYSLSEREREKEINKENNNQPGEVSAKSGEREHDGDITHMAGVLRGLLPLLLTILLLSFLANILLGESKEKRLLP